MKLYGNEQSGHVYKVALALTLAGVPFDYEWVDIDKPCGARPLEFQRLSRFCEVPLLVDGDLALTQSGAILQYLAREYDLLGGMKNYQQASEWIIWEANRIGMCLPQLISLKKHPNVSLQAAKEWLEARLEIDQARLSKALANTPFLCGDEPSIGDIAIFGYVSFAIDEDFQMTSQILEWAQRIRHLPYFQSAQDLLASAQ